MAQLLTDPSFEIGDDTYWSNVNGPDTGGTNSRRRRVEDVPPDVDGLTARTGSWFWEFHPYNSGGFGGGGGISIPGRLFYRPGVTLEPGRSDYVFDFWVAVPGGGAGTLTLFLDMGDGNYVNVWNRHRQGIEIDDGVGAYTWGNYTLENLSALGENGRLYFESKVSGSPALSDYFWLEDVFFGTVEEQIMASLKRQVKAAALLRLKDVTTGNGFETTIGSVYGEWVNWDRIDCFPACMFLWGREEMDSVQLQRRKTELYAGILCVAKGDGADDMLADFTADVQNAFEVTDPNVNQVFGLNFVKEVSVESTDPVETDEKTHRDKIRVWALTVKIRFDYTRGSA